jgi:hypothetical protein
MPGCLSRAVFESSGNDCGPQAGSWASSFLACCGKEAPTCAETSLRDFVAQAGSSVALALRAQVETLLPVLLPRLKARASARPSQWLLPTPRSSRVSPRGPHPSFARAGVLTASRKDERAGLLVRRFAIFPKNMTRISKPNAPIIGGPQAPPVCDEKFLCGIGAPACARPSDTWITK